MVYFLSDTHLGAGYVADRRAHEQRVVAFLDRIAADATELYMLGDILDYWYEYRTVVPRGYVRFFGALARLADAGVKITWLTGNHDIWLFDYLRDEIGIDVVDAPMIERTIAGRRFVLAHGDRVGHAKWSFRFICSLFRNRVCQKLYTAIHPRWTVGFAHRWSESSRAGGSEDFNPERLVKEMTVLARETGNPDYILLGHYHVCMERDLPGGTRLAVLGDWITHDSYGRFDGTTFNLIQK